MRCGRRTYVGRFDGGCSLHHGIAESVSEVTQRTNAALTELVPYGARVALLDHPVHGNVGDHMIWLGQRKALRKLRARTVYACTAATYNRDEMAAILGDGLVLIHGGGNLGDLWPRHQKLREQIIQDFPNNRIIQLPQSIHFTDAANAATARGCLKAHGGVTIMVRDRTSLRLAGELLGIDVVLCPDMAFALGPLKRSRAPIYDTVYLKRTDKEAQGDLPAQAVRQLLRNDATVIECDWLETGRRERILGRMDTRCPSVFRSGLGQRYLRSALYDRQSSICLHRGIRILSEGRRVLTDRLHGFILSVLLGIPVVPLDNSTGKISSFIHTWFGDAPASAPHAPCPM
jgi:exopolysaccharide biosynthesis predicted pyruvyltransferase EpsI